MVGLQQDYDMEKFSHNPVAITDHNHNRYHLDPGVWSPKSRFTGLSNYQRIFMKFYGQLGCGLETNILVTIRITNRIRESIPDHDPDPGITVVRRRSVLSEYS